MGYRAIPRHACLSTGSGMAAGKKHPVIPSWLLTTSLLTKPCPTKSPAHSTTATLAKGRRGRDEIVAGHRQSCMAGCPWVLAAVTAGRYDNQAGHSP